MVLVGEEVVRSTWGWVAALCWTRPGHRDLGVVVVGRSGGGRVEEWAT